MMPAFPHTSVLLDECLAAFQEIALHTFVDGTLGAGGHAEKILENHPELKLLIGIDQDKEALKIAKNRLKGSKIAFLHGNFDELSSLLASISVDQVDGILVDLGVSSMQLDIPERGFSFMREGPLDMRMDQTVSLNAEEIVNTWTEKELADLFFRYGEEKESRRVARAICEDRKTKPFKTTTELAALVCRVLKKTKREIHPATKIFQSLRIAVNGELKRLEIFLPQAIKALRPGGRLAVITFHSLEDRIVKQSFAYYASDKESTSGVGGLFLSKEPEVKIITRKPIEPSKKEMEENPRSRSAKLRVLEKL